MPRSATTTRISLVLALVLGGGSSMGCTADDDTDDDDIADDDDDTDDDDSAPPDLDGDGFPADEDCDDADASVHPGAEEICGNGVDEDCDTIDPRCGPEGLVDLAQADATMLGEGIGDQVGLRRAVTFAGDIDGDGRDDLLVGAIGHHGGAAASGAAYVLYGAPMGVIDLAAADAVLLGVNALDGAGNCVAGASDVDGDGLADLLISAFMSDAGGVDSGVVYMVRGPVSGTMSLADADATIVGEQAGDTLGIDLLGPGDLDGDGYGDVVVGTTAGDAGGIDAGVAYVLRGPLAGTIDVGTAETTLVGEAAGDWAGTGLGAGDFDGDGVIDLVIGARYHDAMAPDDGAIYVLSGPVEGQTLATATAKRWGIAAGDGAGSIVVGAGDVDADGHDDILVGATGNDDGGTDAGAVYLLYGPVTSQDSLVSADATFLGEEADDGERGARIGPAGDVDGDGYGDLLIGVMGHDHNGSNSGSAYLIYGPASGVIGLAAAGAELPGLAAEDNLGFVSTRPGDANGDGYDDLLVAAPYDDQAAQDAGAAFLVLSHP